MYIKIEKNYNAFCEKYSIFFKDIVNTLYLIIFVFILHKMRFSKNTLYKETKIFDKLNFVIIHSV